MQNKPTTHRTEYELLPQLYRGMEYNNAVKLLQKILIEIYGYEVIETTEYGIAFGENTENSVKEFQSKSGLAIDGVVSRFTWEALMENICRSTPPCPIKPVYKLNSQPGHPPVRGYCEKVPVPVQVGDFSVS